MSLASLSYLLTFSSAFPKATPNKHELFSFQLSVPVPPTQDPFYTAPADFESVAPGTILRVRTATGNLTSIFNHSSSAYNLLYRTTNSRYEAARAVTTLFVPLLSPNSIDRSLLSYQIPYNTADVDASPSYSLHAQSSLSPILTDIETALSRGWYVNVADFEGPSASFGLGVQEGHAVLDSVRAALSSGYGLTFDTRYAICGYSSGSIATIWAAEPQIQYAPELVFSGAALGGLVPNVTSLLHSIDGTPAAGLLTSALLGITTQHPAAYDYLVSKTKTSGPYNWTCFFTAKNMSYLEAATTYANQSIIDNYLGSSYSVLQQPVM